MSIQHLDPPLGREAQMAVFLEACGRAEQGAPAGLLFRGESGSGRTHWLQWLRQERAERGWVTLFAACDDRAQVNPYQPFFTALGLTFDKNGEIINDRSVASVIDVIPLADVISAVSQIPGVGAVVAFGLIGKAVLDQHRRPLEAEALLNRNFEFIRQTFAQVYRRKRVPMLLCLDDLQLASASTFALVRHVLAHNPDVPLLVAATWHGEGPPTELAGVFVQHALTPLSDAASGQLIERLDARQRARLPAEASAASETSLPRFPRLRRRGPSAPQAAETATPGGLSPELVKNLVDFSRGLPGFIIEGYRLLHEGAGGNVLEAAAHDADLMVRTIAERHLARVPPEGRALLACAAQFGMRFPLAAISAPKMQAYLGLGERRIIELAAGMAEDGRVLRFDGEDALAFTSTQLVDYLRANVDGVLLRRDQLRIAEAGEEAGLAPGALAHHFLAGGDFARALAHALAAAETHLRDMAYPEAGAAYRLALAALDGLAAQEGRPAYAGRPVERLDLLRSASFAAERAGDWMAAAQWLQEALPLAEGDARGTADIRVQLGWLAHGRGNAQEALANLRAARDGYAALGQPAGVAKACYYEGVVHVAHKNWALAAQALADSIAAAEQAGADAPLDLQALAYLELGNLHRQQRAWTEAERALDAGAALAERSGDAYAQAQSYHYLGMVYGRQEKPEAVAMLEQARAVARDRVRQPHLQAMIENTLAETLVRAQRWAEAETAFRASERLKEQIGDVAGLAMTYGGLARLCLRQWRLDEALGYYRRDLALLERDPEANVAFRQQLHNSLGEVLRLAGRPDEAEAEFRRGLELCAEIPDPVERRRSEGYVHVGFARLALTRGDLEMAEREWVAAEPLLRGTWMEPELDRVLCWLRRAQERYDAAREALARCLAAVDARGEDYEKLQAALERARLARAIGAADELAAALARAREMAERLESSAARELIAREFGAAPR